MVRLGLVNLHTCVLLTHFVRSLILLNYSQPPFKKRMTRAYGPKVCTSPRRVFQTLLDFGPARGVFQTLLDIRTRTYV